MVLRVTFFALMALGLLGLGFIGFAATRPPHAAADAKAVMAPPVRILVAAKALRAGNLLQPGEITFKAVPANHVPAGAIRYTDKTEQGMAGSALRQSLSAGAPILVGETLRPTDHGFMAAVLRPGMRALTINVSSATDTTGLIWPGDHVDLILTTTTSDPTVPMGRRISAETVASDIRVIGISLPTKQPQANGSGGSGARTVTLELNEVEAQKVQVAIQLGRLSLSVRASGSPAHHRATTPTTTFASDVSPALAAPHRAPPKPVAPSTTIKVWSGTSNAKDFKF